MLDSENKKKLLARLKRVEGQIGALRRMVEEETYCVDVLLQIRAAQGALGKAGHVLLDSHVRTCVADAFQEGSEAERAQRVDELLDVFARYGGVR